MIDPFAIKRFSRLHPRRLLYTLWARWQERQARRHVQQYSFPKRVIDDLPPAPKTDQQHTAVQSIELQHLLAAVAAAKQQNPSPVIVEIGSYRGVTSRCLAQAADPGQVICVDPYIGYGGWEHDLALFHQHTADLTNVKHFRQPSGEASRAWSQPIDLVFIDAIHDYVNTRFDIEAWSSKLRPGGFLAAHDTDVPGTRRAVWEFAQRGAEIFAHVENITILRMG